MKEQSLFIIFKHLVNDQTLPYFRTEHSNNLLLGQRIREDLMSYQLVWTTSILTKICLQGPNNAISFQKSVCHLIITVTWNKVFST